MNCNGKKLGFAAIAAPSNPTHSSVGPIASLPSSTSSAPPAPTESSASCTPSCPEDLLDWTRSRVRRAATTSAAEEGKLSLLWRRISRREARRRRCGRGAGREGIRFRDLADALFRQQ
ncbi:unnamed protein product [Linum tenue]|uniref:Uncharacterized protein n=1 Tax=Linum tenue TaxID=586396 RepID=A0AAV0I9C8_9ROSI|nr:unnamed protein product [Linum tenue]